MEFLRLLIIVLLAALLLLVLVLLTTSVLKQREVPDAVSPFHVSVVYTAMLRTSIASVVHGCFYFCPSNCVASVVVVDCAAVETGCLLEKYIKYFSPYPLSLMLFPLRSLLLLLLLRKDMHFFFFGGGAAAANHLSCWLRCCCCWCLCCLKHHY